MYEQNVRKTVQVSVLVLGILLLTGVVSGFAGGDGSADNPYQIENVNQLQNMTWDLDANYILIADIDASETSTWNGGEGFEPIGHSSDTSFFTGSFDGQGNTIEGLYVDQGSSSRAGLFGDIEGAVVKNIEMVDVDITGVQWVGGLVGRSYHSSNVRNANVSGTITGYADSSSSQVASIGGVIGSNEDPSDVDSGTISNVSNVKSDVEIFVEDEASDYEAIQLGGLVGLNEGNISNSYAKNSISVDANQVGGLVGYNKGQIWGSSFEYSVEGNNRVGGIAGKSDYQSFIVNYEGLIANSYATGDVFGDEYVGGLSGEAGNVVNSYATGHVFGEGDRVGGLAGYARSVNNSYSTGNVTGQNKVGGLSGSSGDVYDSYSTGNVTGQDKVGGIVGRALNGVIKNVSYQSRVDGNNEVGGITGVNDGDILDSFSAGKVSGNIDVGGLVGRAGLDTVSDISGSYSRSNISGSENVGGLIGRNDYSVSMSYASGPVDGNEDTGGLIGRNDGTVETSYWDIDKTGQSSSEGGEGLQTSQMIGFSSKLNMDEFDFDTNFVTVKSSYPEIRDNRRTDKDIPEIDTELSEFNATSPHRANGSDPSNVTAYIFDTGGDSVTGLEPEDFDLNLTGSAVIQGGFSEISSKGFYQANVTNDEHDTVDLSLKVRGLEIEEIASIEFGEFFFEVEITGTNDPVVEKDDLEVDFDVENTGNVAVTKEVQLKNFSGVVVDQKEIELGAGENKSGTLVWETEEGDKGTDDIEVVTPDSLDNQTVEIWEYFDPEPFFDIEIVNTNSDIYPGEVLEVKFNVTNEGEEQDTQFIELLDFDGVPVDQKEMTLEGREQKQANLKWETGSEDDRKDEIVVRSENDSDSETVNILGFKEAPDCEGLEYTEEKGYLNIEHLGHLQCINSQDTENGTLSDNYRLVDYIDATNTVHWNNGKGFEPVGGVFDGVFDGQNNEIFNITIDRSEETNLGLFAQNEGEIKHVHVVGEITGGGKLGGITGVQNHGGSVEGVSSNVTIYEGNSAGGLVGENKGLIADSYSIVEMVEVSDSGGLVGDNEDSGVIQRSFSEGEIIGGSQIGGIARYNSGIINNTYSRVDVSGNLVAGLISINYGDVYGSFATGTVEEDDSGLIYTHEGGVIEDSYWDVEATGQDSSDGGGIGLKTSNMTGLSPAIKMNLDYEVWSLVDGDYPTFEWNKAEEFQANYGLEFVEGNHEIYSGFKTDETAIQVSGDDIVIDAGGSVVEAATVINASHISGLEVEDLRIGYDEGYHETMSFEAKDVIFGRPEDVTENPDMVRVGNYFEAESVSEEGYLNINLSYDPTEIPVSADEEDIGIWKFEDEGWSELQAYDLDTENNIVSSNITEFSTFGVFVEDGNSEFNIEIESTNSPIAGGDDLEVEVNVTNIGDETGEQTIELADFDNNQVDSEDIELDADESWIGNLTWVTQEEDIGEDNVTASTRDDEAIETVEILEGADYIVEIDNFDEEVGEGELAWINATVTNIEQVAGDQDIVLEVDSVEEDVFESLELEPDEAAEVNLSWTPENVGDYQVEVSSENDNDTSQVSVVDPSPFFKVDITGTNEPVVEGEDLELDFNVTNQGMETGQQEIELKDFEDEVVDSVELTLDEGEYKTRSLVWSTGEGDAGTDNISVSSENATLEEEVWVQEDANYEVELLEFRHEAVEGDEFWAKVNVSNVGEVDGDQDVVLEVDGEVEDTESLELSPDSDSKVNLTWNSEGFESDDYMFNVSSDDNHVSGNFDVLEPEFFEVFVTEANEPIEGENLEVNVTVDNTGDLTGEQYIELEDFDGELVDGETVEIEGGESRVVELIWSTEEGDAGTDNIEVSSENESVSYEVTIKEPVIFDVEITGTNEPVVEGENLGIDVNVSNIGEVEGTQTVELTDFDDEVTDSVELTLGPDSSVEETLVWETGEGDAGNREVNVSSEDTYDVEYVSVLEPAFFDLEVIQTNNLVEGEEFWAEVSVENIGEVTGEQDVVLEVDSTAVDVESDLEVDSSSSESVNLTWSTGDGDAGDYTFEVSSDDDSVSGGFDVLEPAFFDVDITETNEPVVEGENLEVNVNVSNTGDVEGNQTVELIDFNDQVVDSAQIELIEDDSDQIQLVWNTDEPGEYEINVSSEDTDDQRMVSVLKEPYYGVEVVDFTEDIVAGEEAWIEVNVSNEGDVSGDQNIELEVGGETDIETGLEVQGGDYKAVNLNWMTGENDAGDYTFEVSSNDESVSESVSVLEPAFFELSVDSVPESIEAEEDLVVEYNVENIGEVTGEPDVSFNVDGALIDAENGVAIDPDQSYSDSFVYAPGYDEMPNIDLLLESEDDSVSETVDVVYPEASLELDDFSDQLPTRSEGYDYGVIELDVSEEEDVLTNELKADITVSGDYEGVVLDQNIDVDELRNNSTELEVNLGVLEEADDYTFEVVLDAENADTVEVVDEFSVKEAELEVLDSNISDTEITEGDDVEVEVELVNWAYFDDEKTVNLYQENDEKEELSEKEVMIEARSTKIVVFEEEFTATGEYDILFEEEFIGSIEVFEPPEIDSISVDSPGIHEDNNFYVSEEIEVSVDVGEDIENVEASLVSDETGFSMQETLEYDEGWEGVLNVEDVPDDGEFSLEVSAENHEGAVQTEELGSTIVVDREKPGLSAVVDQTGAEAELIIRADEKLEEAPEVSVEDPEGNTELVAVSGSGGLEWSGQFSVSESGSYDIDIDAVDLAGNEASHDISSTIVPGFSATSDEAGSIVNEDTGTAVEFKVEEDVEEAAVALSENSDSFEELGLDKVGAGFLTGKLDDKLADNLEEAVIWIPVRDDLLNQTGITDPEEFEISRYNESSEEWESFNTDVVEGEDVPEDFTAEKYWRTNVSHFSTYGAVATDDEPPEITDFSPEDGEVFNAGTEETEIQIEYEDDASGVNSSTAELIVNGEDVTDADSTTVTSSYTQYVVEVEQNESYDVEFSISDNAGNERSESWSFEVEEDTESPEIVMISPGDEVDYDVEEVEVEFEYTDEVSGVNPASVSIEINGNDVTDDSDVDSSGVLYLLEVDEGENYEVELFAEDNSGNNGTVNKMFTVGTGDSDSSGGGGGGGGGGAPPADDDDDDEETEETDEGTEETGTDPEETDEEDDDGDTEREDAQSLISDADRLIDPDEPSYDTLQQAMEEFDQGNYVEAENLAQQAIQEAESVEEGSLLNSIPVVPIISVLLVLIVAGAGFVGYQKFYRKRRAEKKLERLVEKVELELEHGQTINDHHAVDKINRAERAVENENYSEALEIMREIEREIW